MKKVEKIMEKIIENEEEIKELFNKESIDDLYKFFLEKDSTLTMEEFDNEVYDILENYSKTEITNVDENELEKISGGKKNLFQGALAASLSVLTLGSSINPSVFAAGSTKVEGTKVSNSSGIKSEIKGKYSGIREWISKNKKTIGIVSGVATVAIITTILVAFGVSRHKKRTVKPPAADQPKTTPASPISVPVTTPPPPPPRKGQGVPGAPPPPPQEGTGSSNTPPGGRNALLEEIERGKPLRRIPPKEEGTPGTPPQKPAPSGNGAPGTPSQKPAPSGNDFIDELSKRIKERSGKGGETTQDAPGATPQQPASRGQGAPGVPLTGNSPAPGGAPLGRGARRPGNPPALGGAPAPSTQFGDGTDKFPAPSAPPAPPGSLPSGTDKFPAPSAPPASGARKPGNSPSSEVGGTSGSASDGASDGTTTNPNSSLFGGLSAKGVAELRDKLSKDKREIEEKLSELNEIERKQRGWSPAERDAHQHKRLNLMGLLAEIQKQLDNLR